MAHPGPMELGAAQKQEARKCFNCGKSGHLAKEYRSEKKKKWEPVPSARTVGIARRSLTQAEMDFLFEKNPREPELQEQDDMPSIASVTSEAEDAEEEEPLGQTHLLNET
ncbi:hypothetical protein SLS53_005129 [Cytospora paraplurivora]|uniref:CCHC-type domain-containing protein n=1 Tax=Cytospora paraplurivora TaxID=2898453 RepID=A0AAN9UDY4_9PEZI